MSKPSRSKRKELDHYKLMQRTEKQVEARLKKEMNRFKDKDQFELEDHIIDLENKIKELNEKIRGYQARYEGGIYNPISNEYNPRSNSLSGLSWADYTSTQDELFGGPTTGDTQPIPVRAETRPTYEFTGTTMPPPIPQETVGDTYQRFYGTVNPQPDVRTPAESTLRIRR